MKHIIFTIALFSSIMCFSQHERYVYWLHGYQGDKSSLRKVGDYVGDLRWGSPAGKYKAISQYPSYNPDQQSLYAAQKSAGREINRIAYNRPYGTSRDFIIAHSMGGLVARQMGNLTNRAGRRLFNGLITIGTPHQGAKAADFLLYKRLRLRAIIDDACNSLADGPSLAKASTSNLGIIATHLGLVNKGRAYGCKEIANVIAPLDPNKDVPLFNKGVERDLTTYNARNIPAMRTAHNAVFYGTETDGYGTLTARFLGAMLQSPNTYPLFKAYRSDAWGITVFSRRLAHYQTEMNKWSNKTSWWPFKKSRYRKLARAYGRGVTWIKNSNSVWKEIIGANNITLKKTGCICKFRHHYGSNGGVRYLGNASTDCSALEASVSGVVRCADHYEAIKGRDKDSDGFILKESVINAPGRNYPLQHMRGSNHMQMKNDNNMQDAVEKIFDQGLGKDFFYTPKR